MRWLVKQTTGKTFFTLSLIKLFLEKYEGSYVIFFETEGATDTKTLESHGIDTSRVFFIDAFSIEEFKQKAYELVLKYEKDENRPKIMFVLDSLGQLSTLKEIEDTKSKSDKKDFTRQQAIKSSFRVLTLKLAKLKIPFIVTNHVYAAIGAYITTDEMSGGSGLKYAATSIAFLTKSKEKDDKTVTGNIIKVVMNKSRLSKEWSVIKTKIDYSSGLDRYYGLLDFAVQAGLWEREAAKYYDVKILQEESKKLTKEMTKAEKKAVEDKAYELALIGHEDEINAEPEKYFTKEFLDKLEPWVKEAFEYGTGTALSITAEELAKEIGVNLRE